ncbi:diaminopimelate decarboxylase (plasmid) [Antarctobacter heliothermus]|uniref:Diaminopimelate decarboxylase n=1 Tax=Antarctobacter heliothermus TaxID=74033 RepID=A0A222EBZ0_9RHOB|nr:hypothetical protein [Antarctobacter heliothermus]ASP23714.1 diaminopimelate decarboxylase [Antarctobacter heliothermus]
MQETEPNWLAGIGGRPDGMAIDETGQLRLGGISADRLVREHGSPLYVTLEQVIRDNVRRLQRALDLHWPTGAELFYAIKTNNCLAIRSILTSEGVGGECFGDVEYRATHESGVPTDRILLNGSDKTERALTAAVAGNSVINIDSLDEIDVLSRLAVPESPVRVNIRLRLAPLGLDRFDASFFKNGGTASESLLAAKWGFSEDAAAEVVARLLCDPKFDLLGYSSHVGRFTSDPAAFGVVGEEIARFAMALRGRTGFWPRVLDLGGGWPRLREPESRVPSANTHDIDAYVAAMTTALRDGLDGKLPCLWLEPGRYLVGNAVVLLGAVTTIRSEADRRWVHVDASTNLLMRIETSRSWYHILPASCMTAPVTGKATIVGPTCVPSVLGADRPMPNLQRGDVVAIPDAGMYAEVLAPQFNGMPRPAGVMVAPDGGVDLVRRREAYDEIFRNHVVPERLAAGGPLT